MGSGSAGCRGGGRHGADEADEAGGGGHHRRRRRRGRDVGGAVVPAVPVLLEDEPEQLRAH